MQWMKCGLSYGQLLFLPLRDSLFVGELKVITAWIYKIENAQ